MPGVTAPHVPITVRTRGDAGEEEVDRAIVWVVQRRKVVATLVVLVVGGISAGWTMLTTIEATAEERILRRQAAQLQSAHVRANGEAVAELSDRVANIERAVESHAELTRTGIALLMASPSVAMAMEQDESLRARAAKAVSTAAE